MAQAVSSSRRLVSSTRPWWVTYVHIHTHIYIHVSLYRDLYHRLGRCCRALDYGELLTCIRAHMYTYITVSCIFMSSSSRPVLLSTRLWWVVNVHIHTHICIYHFNHVYVCHRRLGHCCRLLDHGESPTYICIHIYKYITYVYIIYHRRLCRCCRAHGHGDSPT